MSFIWDVVNHQSYDKISVMDIRFYNQEVEKFIKHLEKFTIAKVLRVFDLLEKFGSDLKMPHSKNIGVNLFELRIRGSQEVRFIYTFQKEKIIIVLCGFVKKSNRIPQKEINKALSRKKKIDII